MFQTLTLSIHCVYKGIFCIQKLGLKHSAIQRNYQIGNLIYSSNSSEAMMSNTKLSECFPTRFVIESMCVAFGSSDGVCLCKKDLHHKNCKNLRRINQWAECEKFKYHQGIETKMNSLFKVCKRVNM